MQPISGGRLTCHRSDLSISPAPTSLEQHYDYFGNLVQTFSIEGKHQSLSVAVQSDVTVASNPTRPSSDSPPWESLLMVPGQRPVPQLDEHRYRSPRITPSRAYAEYAAASFDSGRGIVRIRFRFDEAGSRGLSV